MTSKKLETIVEPGQTSFTTERVVDAPCGLVFEAFTRPEYLKRWLVPGNLTMVSCESEVQVGGHYRFLYRDSEGKEVGHHGEYREIDYPERIVRTFVYEPFPDKEAIETFSLQESNGKTTITTISAHKTVEDRDGHFYSGTEAGLTECYEKLDRLLAEVQASQPHKMVG